MGKLRKEPKEKPFLSEKEYKDFRENLMEAKKAANHNHVYWDLDPNENGNHSRKAFLHVAEKESIPVTIRRVRGTHSLAFTFKDASKSSSTRMSAEECRERIMNVLRKAKKPLQKSEIISVAGVSSSTWNIRIKELIKAGKVQRQGDRRDTKYFIE